MTEIQSTSGFAPIHNGRLFYEAAGSGPSVLLIHAGVADHRMWDPTFNVLSKDHRVIRYDARGYGKTTTEDTEFSNRQDIVDLLNHLGVDKTTVVGISRGGQIAIDFTVEHPERVSALVAVAAGIGGYDFQAGDNEIAKKENKFFEHLEDLWEKKEFDELTGLEVHAWADGPALPEGRASSAIREYMRKVVRSNFDRQDGKATPIPLDPPAFDRLSQINVPTLIMVGEYDVQSVLAAADELECHIPLARKVGFPKTAHMIPMEQPDKFNEILLGFLNDLV